MPDVSLLVAEDRIVSSAISPIKTAFVLMACGAAINFESSFVGIGAAVNFDRMDFAIVMKNEFPGAFGWTIVQAIDLKF